MKVRCQKIKKGIPLYITKVGQALQVGGAGWGSCEAGDRQEGLMACPPFSEGRCGVDTDGMRTPPLCRQLSDQEHVLLPLRPGLPHLPDEKAERAADRFCPFIHSCTHAFIQG